MSVINKNDPLWRKQMICKRCIDIPKTNCGYSHSQKELDDWKIKLIEDTKLCSKSFDLALSYLFINRIKYNTLIFEKQKSTGSFLNFDCTNAYGTLIYNFKTYLVDKVNELLNKHNISFNYAIMSSLCNSFQGNCNDNYQTEFIKSLTKDLENYPLIIKEYIIEYCNIFINETTIIDDKTDIKIITAYFAKLLIPIFYIFSNEYDKSLNNIIELNNITKKYDIEFTKFVNYNIYYIKIIENIINKKSVDCFKIIGILENYNEIIDKHIIPKVLKDIKEIVKPIDVKPIDVKLIEVKPIDVKLIEVKPIDVKLIEVKPIEVLIHNEETKTIKKKTVKAKIPSAVRKIVWNTYIGKDNVKGKCLCCNAEEITGTNFECGHVKSEKNGGEVTIDNLRPICSSCNKSMSSNDMDEFMSRYKINKPKIWNGIN